MTIKLTRKIVNNRAGRGNKGLKEDRPANLNTNGKKNISFSFVGRKDNNSIILVKVIL